MSVDIKLKEFLEAKDIFLFTLLNYIISKKDMLYKAKILNIDDLLIYFETINADYPTDYPLGFWGDDVIFMLVDLDRQYLSLTDELQQLVNNPQMEFNKLHNLLVKMRNENKGYFDENRATTNKINNTVDRIERDMNPKPEQFPTKEDFLTALARKDGNKL